MTARFTGPGTADIGGVPVRFRQALVATGSDPALPPIPGLTAADPLCGARRTLQWQTRRKLQ